MSAFNALSQAETKIMNVLDNFVYIPAGHLTVGLAIVTIPLITMWMVYRSYLIMAGLVAEPLLPLMKDLLLKFFIISFATSTAFYVDSFVTPINAIITDMAKQLSGTDGSSIFLKIEQHLDETLLALTAVTTGEVDQSVVDKMTAENGGEPLPFWKWGWGRLQDGVKSVTNTVTDALPNFSNILTYIINILKLTIIIIGLLIFAINAFLAVIMNKFFFSIALAVGPLFIFFAAFELTRSYFFSWLSSVLNYGFAYVIIMMVVGVLFRIFGEIYGLGGLSWVEVLICFAISIVFSALISQAGDISGQLFGAGNNLSDKSSGLVAAAGVGTGKVMGMAGRGSASYGRGARALYRKARSKSSVDKE